VKHSMCVNRHNQRYGRVWCRTTWAKRWVALVAHLLILMTGWEGHSARAAAKSPRLTCGVAQQREGIRPHEVELSQQICQPDDDPDDDADSDDSSSGSPGLGW